ncbi:MAG: flagellar hook-basal body complex protein [Verrucomicrobiota bacterium]|jgi:flagellar hook protein FlgE|nr:flagellar hook-basal body complex protein [Verrucomicrobiota bacterium]
MIRSLNTGVQGVRQYQTSLDAIGNNLANINTVAYKSARIDFADTLNQTLRAPTPDTETGSGTSGMQVGNGLAISAIKNSFEQGAIKQTGVRTDLAVAGAGFFLVKDPTTNELFATRAGDFRLDKNSFLVTNGGFRVQGLNKQAPAYTADEKKEIGDLQLDVGKYREDVTGITVTPTVQEDETTEEIEYVASKLTLADHGFSTGQQVKFKETDEGKTVPVCSPEITVSTVLYVRTTLGSTSEFSLHSTASDAAAGTNAINVSSAPGTYDLTGGASISSFNVGVDGQINMLLTDGTQYSRGQVRMQDFANKQNLMKQGSNLYSNLATAGALGTTGTSASATEILSGAESPGNSGLGRIESGALELSNVDMAKEFAKMITTQRAFQANARVITTSDEILQEMMQLKR